MSSRVGESTSAEGEDRRLSRMGRGEASSRAIVGSRKDAVLPDPVCAHAITSLPPKAAGMVCFWIGVGFE